MPFDVVVDPCLVWLFAKAVHDDDPLIIEQRGALPGTPLVTPLTFLRAVAEHFDDAGDLRQWPDGEPTPAGGSSGQLHAEQHFEYYKPLRAGARLRAVTYGGRTWTKTGRAGVLNFGETVTDFLDDTGELVVRTVKVGVRLAPAAAGK